jgi:hypothetical protein
MSIKVLVASGVACAACGAASASVSWSFDADTQGWGTLNDAREFEWDGTIGQPAGAIRARDIGDGRIWYFAAPVADISNAAGMYGGEIGWDVLGIQGNQASFGGRADLMLVGGGLAIGIDLGTQPVNGQWVSSTAQVSEAGGWRVVTSLASGALGASVSEADIRAVLAGLSGFYIQGEYTNGADRSGLDNVYFVPSPGGAGLLAIAGLGAMRRRR